ncbi:hypothetical protein [Hymenobacter weizhouensis]|uniref:hypothetical protein n=1 Tax=Hymenobacter sp. YIM 151500-1 TaxID=2987689 RepID=UPI002226F676|nr:hypothetical protein [Hymenobacter sp. YIM 151500-1]UYZ63709.1 hypothetical protein OIS53_02430 [Hymenobacter sp. YIM 151500-1]
MLTIAQLLEQGAVELVLLDMNKLPSLGLEEQFWVATSWLPTVSVPVLQRVALVLPQTNMYNQMVVESVLRTGQPFIHYDIQFFTDAAGAMDWLVGQVPAQLAALETEWHHYNPVLMQPA